MWKWLGALLLGVLLATPVAAQTQTQCVTNAIAGGTANALTVPLLPCGFSTNLLILTTPLSNTGSATLQMTGFAAQPIVNANNLSSLSNGQLPGGNGVVLLTPNGTEWLLLQSVPGTTPVATLNAVSSGNFSGISSLNILGRAAVNDGGGGIFNKVSSCSINGATCVEDLGGNFFQREDALTGIYQTAWFPGSDIGAQVNAAYLALPSTGGTIVTTPPSGGGCLNYTTPILFTTLGKYPIFDDAGVCLNFTPTSGAAITMDYAITSNVSQGGHGLRNVFLENNGCTTTGGCGSSAIGVLVTQVNGGEEDAQMFGVTLEGFGVAYKNLTPTISVGTDWFGGTFIANTVALELTTSEKFHGGSFVANGKNYLSVNNTPTELYMWGINTYDSSGSPNWDFSGTTNPSYFSCTDCHFENNTATAAYYIGGNVNIHLTGGLMEDDNSTPAANLKMIATTGYTLVIDGTYFQAPRTYSTIVAGASSGVRSDIRPVNGSPANITTWVNGTAAAWATICPIVAGGSVNAPQTCSREAALSLGSTLAVAGATTLSGGVTVTGGITSVTNESASTGIYSTGSTPTVNGTCTIGAQQGGGETAGTFRATCSTGQTAVINFPTASPTGWNCTAQDQTTPADLMRQTGFSTTSCTLTSAAGTASSDVIVWSALGF